MTDEPTDEALENLFVEETGFDIDDFPAAIFDFARAVLAKWGTPAPVGAEPVAWLRNTTDPQPHAVTNLKYRSAVDAKAGVEYIPVFAAPQPVAREPLTPEQIQDLLLCGDPTDEEMRLIRIGWDAAHGIKGGQHG